MSRRCEKVVSGGIFSGSLQVRPFQSRLAAPKARPDDGFPTATSSPLPGRRSPSETHRRAAHKQ